MMETSPVSNREIYSNETKEDCAIEDFDVVFKTVGVGQRKLSIYGERHTHQSSRETIGRAVSKSKPVIVFVEGIPFMKELSTRKGIALLKKNWGIPIYNKKVRVMGWDANQEVLDRIGTPRYAVPSIQKKISVIDEHLEMIQQNAESLCAPLPEQQRAELLPLLKSLNEVIDSRERLIKLQISSSQSIESREEIIQKPEVNSSTPLTMLPILQSKIIEYTQSLEKIQTIAKTAYKTVLQDAERRPLFKTLSRINRYVDNRKRLRLRVTNKTTNESIKQSMPSRTQAAADTVDVITALQSEGIIKGNVAMITGVAHVKIQPPCKDIKEFSLDPFYRALSKHPGAIVLIPKVISQKTNKTETVS